MDLIKINIPSNEDSYKSGNGEGCWAFVNEQTKTDYDNDKSGSGYEAILHNDSVYYTGLNAGTKVPIEMRGEYRPVVPYKWLVENYGESNW